MADRVHQMRFRAEWVDKAIAAVIRDEGLDMADPFVARMVARLRARLDQVEIRFVLAPPQPEVPS